MATSKSPSVWVRFDQFQVDLSSCELLRSGVPVPLQEQPFQVLRLLLQSAGTVVTREELCAALWPSDTFVDFELGLNTAVKKLRQALEDSAEHPRYIETLHRRGYRFICPVEWAPNDVRGAVAEAQPAAQRGPALLVPNQSRDVEPQLPQPVPESPSPPWWKRKSMIAATVCLVIAGLLYPLVTPEIERLWRLLELQQLKVLPLTTLPGNVASPTFSPDGSQVAFSWDGENNGVGFDVYVKVIGSDRPLRLTSHPAVRLSVAWSPDGRNLAMSRAAGENDSGIYLIAPTGGPERKIASRSTASWFGNEVSWSPDGKSLAYIDHPPNTASDATLHLYLLSLDSLDKSRASTSCDSVSTPAFSPRGTYLAWVCNDDPMNISSIRLLRLKDGKQTRLLSRSDLILGMAWSSDERRITFSSRSEFGALWEVSLARPTNIQRLLIGHDASDLAADPAGHWLAYVQGSVNVNIWRLDLSTSPPQARKLVASSREQTAPNISPDGSMIAFESTRSGAREIWICDADGSNARQVSDFGQLATGTPRWSPDGELIAFDSRVSGEAAIYTVDPHGGVPRKLNIGLHGNSVPAWSQDGAWIYFANESGALNDTVWKVPSKGGRAVQIAGRDSFFPLESADGQHVYFVRNDRLWQVKTDGSTEELVTGMPDLHAEQGNWSPFGSGVYFVARVGDKTVLNLFDLKSKQVRRIFTLEKPAPDWIGGIAVSKDGKWLLFPQVDQSSSDLMLIENWR